MIRGSIFTLGVLTAIGSVVIGGLMVLGGGMSDDIRAGSASASSGFTIGGVGLAIGIAACIGAWLL